MSNTKSPIWKALLGMATLAAVLAATPCLAQSAPAQPSDSLAVNLLALLVKKGVIAQDDADQLLKTAQAQTEQAKAAVAANQPVATMPAPASGVIRVPYVPQVVRDQIRDMTKSLNIPDLIKEGTVQYGMQSFDQSLMNWYSKKAVSFEQALFYATNPNEFTLRVQGIEGSSDTTWDDFQRDVSG